MRKLFIVLLMHLFLYAYPQAEIRNVSQLYTTTDTIYPFRYSDYCSAIYVDGSCEVLSEDGFVRIILIDNNEEEWLIYERNNLFSTEICDKFTNASFETFMMDNVVPVSVIIELKQATVKLDNFKISKASIKNKISYQTIYDSIFLQKNLELVNRINDTLLMYKKAWRADTTFLSNMRYHDKKKIFNSNLPNLKGWDYYAYGYYSPLDDKTPQASDNIIKEFDWRTRHGASVYGSYYYNHDGSGWIPKRRYGQVLAECWAFSTVYSVEAMVNLYFNRQYNDELSVQDVLSCSDGGTWDEGGSSDEALDHVKNVGVVNDQCFPFRAYQDIPCEDKCDNPMELVSITDFSTEITGEENIKQNLITKGPLVTSVYNWGHAVSMIGFGIVKAGEPILNADNNNFLEIFVTEDSPDIGKPYYIFKQSYATYGYDESAFCNIIINANNNMHAHSIVTPINSQLYSRSQCYHNRT